MTILNNPIRPGSDWSKELDSNINKADIILLLISADFIVSDYAYSVEMQRAMERHNAQEAYVIPILLRPVDWESTPFSHLQTLPSNGKPITYWSSKDAAFFDVAQGIREAVERVSNVHLAPSSIREITPKQVITSFLYST